MENVVSSPAYYHSYGQPSKRLQNTLGVPFDVTGQDKILLGIQPQY